jgi:hypothetical protein
VYLIAINVYTTAYLTAILISAAARTTTMNTFSIKKLKAGDDPTCNQHNATTSIDDEVTL